MYLLVPEDAPLSFETEFKHGWLDSTDVGVLTVVKFEDGKFLYLTPENNWVDLDPTIQEILLKFTGE